VGSQDATDVCLETGHIGIYVSSKCQKEFAPRIAAWLAERDVPDRKARKKKSAAAKQPSTKTAAKPETSQRRRKQAKRSAQ
jgi:polyhydroxyalkanoate synthase